MRIEFLGTAGPMSVPRPLCTCGVCQEAREKGVPYSRSGPGLFLHGPDILFDTSEDILFQINRSAIQHIRGVFYSHWHPDHVMGRRVFESMNANYVNHPPMNTCTDVYLPEQVALDFNQFLGSGEHLGFLQNRGYVTIHEMNDEDFVTVGGSQITPVRLAERYAYGFLIEDGDRRVVIVPDELRDWEPDSQLYGVDIAVLPIGVFECHPITGERLVAADHPVLKAECTFSETVAIIRKLDANKTYLTHINGLGFDELKQVEKKLREDGLNIEMAYDTLVVDVG